MSFVLRRHMVKRKRAKKDKWDFGLTDYKPAPKKDHAKEIDAIIERAKRKYGIK